MSSSGLPVLTRLPAMNSLAAPVVLVGFDGPEAGGLSRRLGGGPRVVVASREEIDLAAIERGAFSVVVAAVAAGTDLLTGVAGAVRKAPATTLLILGDSSPDLLERIAGDARVRFLPDSSAPGVLEEMVEDYRERHQLLGIEHVLSRQLDEVQLKLRELDRQLHEDGFQSTTSVLRLYHVISGLSGLTTPQEVGELLVSTVAGMFRSRRVSLLVPDAGGEWLTIAAAVGIAADEAATLRFPVGSPIVGEVFLRGNSALIKTDHLPARWKHRGDTVLVPSPPFMIFALVGPDAPVGVLCISDPADPAAYDEGAVTGLHAIVEAAAIALDNQIRGRERNEARDGIMMALAKLAESRDPETGTHLERVQNYCRLLAETLARKPRHREIITPEFINTLVWSSPLHDIGKVGVPDHILLKPGRFTPEEFEIMKQHSTIGGNTIRTLMGQGRRQAFLQMAMDIAYHHHERFDGTGYPGGLAGDSIPLAARIVALADVYDAMTTARVYKPAMPHEEALELIVKGRGSQFDPDMVDAFLERAADFKKLGIELADSLVGTPPIPGGCAGACSLVRKLQDAGGGTG